MSLSINLSNAAALAAQDSAFGNANAGASLPLSAALDTSSVESVDNAPALSVTLVDPKDHTRLDKYLKALGAPLKMGVDASNIANAMVPLMQSVIQQRPDLANAQFDFKADNGAITVTSQSMSVADKSWLQGKLNGDIALTSAVRAFHDDAVEGYATWADADGNPLSSSETEAVSKQADGLTSFMSLFRNIGSLAQSSMMTGGTYHTSSGTKVDFSQDPGSASGLLKFMQGVQAATYGTVSFTTSSGRTTYGVMRGNIFEMNSTAMPQFFPPSDTRSIGIDETV